MSLRATGSATAERRSTDRAPLRALPVASSRPQPGGRAFVALVVLVLTGGLVGLLLLNTAMQRSAFQLEALKDKTAALTVRSEVLDTQVERLRAPARLANAANRLGMVPMSAPVFLRLFDGQVIGDPQPAAAPPPPAVAEPRVAQPMAQPAPQSQRASTRPPDPRAPDPRPSDPRLSDPRRSGGRG